VGTGLAGGLATLVAASWVTARELLGPPRWRWTECFPGEPFARGPGRPAGLPAALIQEPGGLRVVEAWSTRAGSNGSTPLQKGDLLLSVDGVSARPVAARELALALCRRHAGDKVTCELERCEAGGPRRQGVTLTLDYAAVVPSDLGLAYKDISLRAADGRIVRGWYLPAAGVGKRDGGEDPAPAIVYLHGRQTNRRFVGLTDLAARAHAAGFALLLVDLFGSGDSDGDVDFWGVEETRLAVEFLRCRPEVDPARIGLVGVSFGGQKALTAAADASLGIGPVAVVAVAGQWPIHVRLVVGPAALPAFVQRRLVAGMDLPGWLVAIGRPLVFGWVRRQTGRDLAEADPLRVAAGVRRPVLIAHGTADRTFLPETAKLLFDAIPTPKELIWLDGYDHYGAAQAGNDLWDSVFAFVRRHMGLGEAPAPSVDSRNGHRPARDGRVPVTAATASSLGRSQTVAGMRGGRLPLPPARAGGRGLGG
jgi:hypothetical protein